MSEKIVVGIDMSKAFSDICILSPNNGIIKRIKISNAEAKYEKLLQASEKSKVCIVNLSSAVLIQTTVSVNFSLQKALKAIK